MEQKQLLKIIEKAAKEKSTCLSLIGRGITSLPAEIGMLTNLTRIDLSYNRLTSIPAELEKLTNLTRLDLHRNQLPSIPAELGKLTKLTTLNLSDNQLTSIPAELGKLTNLKTLYLYGNHLTSIPAELGKLTKLTELWLHANQLTNIPAELGKLTKLDNLYLDHNEALTSPPPGIVNQGTKAILAYLQEQFKEQKKQWVSKLLVVGEGGVGKTSLLRALRSEGFFEGLETTHGIGVEKLELAHPKQAGITMELNTWDFGGQQIYHATHQFFFTNRSLFALVWDARHGWEAGKLYNWLDRIQTKAPESPVIVVAAHIDERDADLPLDDLQRKYPQIKGHYKLSNKTGEGIEEFKERLAELAADLPLMGEEWPASWLDAADTIRERTEQYISPKKFYRLVGKHKVRKKDRDILAQWMHDLGDILYFMENEELNDLVILDPAWVNEKISRVLESRDVIKKDGIFTRWHMDELWADISDESIRQHLIRLMEQFDLSYRTLENREISLVVERLPLDPPDYRETWDAILDTEGCKEISMKFKLGSIQAGLPTWFIARSHRFTTHTHWRAGALFADCKERRHLALIEAHEYERYLRLTVRGLAPHNFFALLRDGLELTLARFPGLKIKRKVPCPGHAGGRCPHEFDLGQLQKAIELEMPVMEVQCQETFENVSVPRLLFGLDRSTEGSVASRIDELQERIVGGQEAILTEWTELAKLAQRQFLMLFKSHQRLAESHCPNVFAVLPKGEQSCLENLFSQKMVLQFYCQAPGHWHPVDNGAEGGRYEVRQPAEFLESMGPYILKLAKVIKFAVPVAGAAVVGHGEPIGPLSGPEDVKRLEGQIKLMEELAERIKQDRRIAEGEPLGKSEGVRVEIVEKSPLGPLRRLLYKEDAKWEQHIGLKKVLTPEGHYLWLCKYHAREYQYSTGSTFGI